MKSVYVVGKNRWCGPSTAEMFADEGWNVIGDEILQDIDKLRSVDLVVFTGGSDISPHLYGEENISSSVDHNRDTFETDVYYSLLETQAKAGICRGLQLLNVLNGGKLIQDHGHLGGYKEIFDHNQFGRGMVNVCHHQGVLAPTEGIDPESVVKIDLSDYKRGGITEENHPIYSGFYPETNSFGVQWHPEWGHGNSKKLWFDWLDQYFGLRVMKKKEAA